MATKKWLTPTVTQHFQIREIWGENAENCTWKSGSPYRGIKEGTYSGTDSIASGKYTAAWFAYFTVKTRVYITNDSDDIFVEVKITTNHNKLWTSNESPAGGYIDIGIIVWNPGRKAPDNNIDDKNTNLYLNNQDSSLNQLYTWAKINKSNIVCGVMADNGKLTGQTLPNGTWGTHASGYDHPESTDTFTLKLDDSCFKSNGELKEEYKVLPFVWASRWRHENNYAGMAVSPTLGLDYINLSDTPFVYIPWAIRKKGNFVSCNRDEGDLKTFRKGGFNHTVINSFFARVINGNIPANAQGFRIQNKKWDVSPLTPPDADD